MRSIGVLKESNLEGFVMLTAVRIVLAAAAAAIMAVPMLAQGAPDGHDLLARYEKQVSRLARLKFDSVTTTYQRGGKFATEQWINTTKVSFHRDGDAWRRRRHSVGRSFWRGAFDSYDKEYEELVDGAHFNIRSESEIEEDLTEQTAFPASPREKTKLDLAVMFNEGSANEEQINPMVGLKLYQLAVPRVIYGYLPFDGRSTIFEIMREAGVQVGPENEEIDGHVTYVVSSDSPYGKHTVWIDPQAGHLPRRIRIEKDSKDLYGKDSPQPLGELPPSDARSEYPTSPRQSCVYDIRDIELEALGGEFVISGYSTEMLLTHTNGETFRTTEEIRLSNIDLEPNRDDLVLTMEIPDGTPIGVFNYPAIECEWRDGEIRKVVDGQLVASLADLDFRRPEVSSLRVWIIVINAALIGFAVCAYFWFRSRRGASEPT